MGIFHDSSAPEDKLRIVCKVVRRALKESVTINAAEDDFSSFLGSEDAGKWIEAFEVKRLLAFVAQQVQEGGEALVGSLRFEEDLAPLLEAMWLGDVSCEPAINVIEWTAQERWIALDFFGQKLVHLCLQAHAEKLN